MAPPSFFPHCLLKLTSIKICTPPLQKYSLADQCAPIESLLGFILVLDYGSSKAHTPKRNSKLLKICHFKNSGSIIPGEIRTVLGSMLYVIVFTLNMVFDGTGKGSPPEMFSELTVSGPAPVLPLTFMPETTQWNVAQNSVCDNPQLR